MRHFKTLYVQVLLAIVLGLWFGAEWPQLGVSLEPLALGFVKLIKLVVAPVVFCTVAGGIAHMADVRRFGQIGVKALIYFEAVSTFALLLGLAVGMAVGPGRGFNPQGPMQISSIETFVHKSQNETLSSFLLGIIPDSLFTPFATGDLLPIILVSILVGFALIHLGESGRKFAQGLDSVSQIFFGIIRMIVKLAPIGAFGGMAFMIGKFGVRSLEPLGLLIATFYLTAILFVAIVLGVVAQLAGFSIFRFVRYIGEELLIVLGASSSESVLPQLMRKLERLGVPASVVGVVVPAGYSFNLDGTNIYMTLAILFLAQATHTPLSAQQLLTILLVSMLTSKGASGVSGAGFVTLAATLSAVQTIPLVSLSLLVGVDRFMSECRALTNTVGNGVASIVVAAWNQELDREQLAQELSRPRIS